jgi:hypothetical protein
MLNPSDVIAQIITKIKSLDGYAALGLCDVIEINEKPSHNVRPPYVGIYFDLDEAAPERNSSDDILSIPISIYVWIFSRSFQKVSEAFSQAFDIMTTIRPAINGTFTVSGKKVIVKPKARPYEIMSNTADGVILNMRYIYNEYDPY